MLDPIAAYRSAQVTTASPAARIVLLYEGAIRNASVHLDALERRDPAAAHNASIRCQDIVSALSESLDLTAGPVAENLHALYGFVHARLVAGNVAKDPEPTREALIVLRDLLPAWQAVAGQPQATAGAPTSSAAFTPMTSAAAMAMPVRPAAIPSRQPLAMRPAFGR